VRPPIRDPLQRRRKDVLLRAEEDVIRAADALARRVGVSRNEALNAMLRAFVQDETDPALRLATLVQAMITAGAAATVEAIRQEARRRCCIERSPRPAASTRPPKQSILWARSRVPSRFLGASSWGEPPLRRA